MRPVILVLNAAGLPLAQRIRQVLPEAEIHGLADRVQDVDRRFSDTGSHLRTLFADGRPIIGLCAAGILIRSLASVLDDKRSEPPVLAVAPDGRSVVPLLGGHHGANALSLRLAEALGSHAALTSASDLLLGLPLDEPPPGWLVGNPDMAKPLMAALIAGEAVRLEIEDGDASWLAGLPTDPGARLGIRTTIRSGEVADTLLLHPVMLALGVGCERGTDPDELIGLAEGIIAGHGLARRSIACVVSVDLKADEPAVHDLARALGVPARFFPASVLEELTPRLANPSEVVFAEIGCHGVAEGAALAATGDGGRLLVPKVKSARATCAVALSDARVVPEMLGAARGRLFVTGIGPGTDVWRSPEASAAIAESTDLVGYGLYLDLLGPLATGKARHESGLGAEEARARRALELAGQGHTVALVCSGDAGIYALATLVFELMDRENRPEWNRLEINVVPGISALQAAASRIGAPINHDFCTISLSDLLTPWPAIERRLNAAAQGDFVVAFYNPVSQRRRDQLARARAILLTGRPGDTPVVLARNLGRADETVSVITLDELTPDHADMLTLVLVGNSETRRIRRGMRDWVYTPRGYANKMNREVDE